jgi:hypothetical protein
MTNKPETELVTIRTCRDLQEAQILRGMLEAGGIRAFIPDENAASLYPATVLDTNGVRLQVASADATLARELLERE